MTLLPLLVLVLHLALHSTLALRFPIHRLRQNDDLRIYDKRATLQRIGKAASVDGNGDSGLTTVNDLLYMANVTIGGAEFQLQLDSGSSDLWVATSASSIPNTKSTSVTYNLTYGVGYAAGSVNQASVTFAGYTVPSQAYLLATQANNPISSYGGQGILGLGFDSLSSIDSAVNASGASWGRSYLMNVFNTNKTTPNYISFALQRANDSADTIQGEVTIGEVVPGFEAVLQQPAVPTFPEVNPNRWNLALDAIFINGVARSLTSTVQSAPSGKVIVLADTGTSYIYADPDTVQAIYGGISGATLDTSSGLWSVPCDAEVDITLVIGGQPYPLHPLDVVDYDVSNPKVCVGTFVGQSVSVGAGEFDWLMGDVALRSMYTVYDYGDFDSSGKMGNPYFKILSITNATAASADFHNLRGGQANTTISASGVDLNGTTIPSTSGGDTGSLSTQQLDTDVSKLLNYMPAILGILALNSLVLLCLAGCALVYFVRRGRSKKNTKNNGVDYHYSRVRSQYDPKDIPLPSTPQGGNTLSGNPGPVAGGSARQSVRGSFVPPPNPSRHGSSTSVHTLGNASVRNGGNFSSNSHGQDEAFTPPVESHEEGDLTSASLAPPEGNYHSPSQQNSPPLITPMNPNPYIGVGPAPAPRQRFTSTTTMDSYGRPQSLFSVASGPLLSAGNMAARPSSTYDIPLGSTRPRFVSDAMSDGRPESTFSTTPLIRRSNSGELLQSSPTSGGGPSAGMSASPGTSAQQQQQQQTQENGGVMSPPRPRFMSDVSPGPRPDSTFSMGSTNGSPLRPQSRYMDASGPRPSSEAN